MGAACLPQHPLIILLYNVGCTNLHQPSPTFANLHPNLGRPNYAVPTHLPEEPRAHAAQPARAARVLPRAPDAALGVQHQVCPVPHQLREARARRLRRLGRGQRAVVRVRERQRLERGAQRRQRELPREGGEPLESR